MPPFFEIMPNLSNVTNSPPSARLPAPPSQFRRLWNAPSLRQVVRVGVCGGFVYLLARMIDLPTLKEVLGQVRPGLIMAAILIYFGNIAIRAYRLQRIFQVKGPAIKFQQAYALTLVGVALNMVIPATLGDVARSYYGYKVYGFKEEMLSSVLADKMFAFCSLFILGAVSGAAMGYTGLAAVSGLAAMLTCLPLVWPRLIPWGWLNMGLRPIRHSLDAGRLIQAFTLPTAVKIEVMLISMGGWLCTCVYFYIVCRAFPVTVSLWYVIAIMPMLTIARLFPFTLNALGPMEVATAYFFGLIGIPSTLAVVVALTSNLIASVVPGSLGVLIILTAKRRGSNDKNDDRV
jgi:glycosyltransferase 2 family protein